MPKEDDDVARAMPSKEDLLGAMQQRERAETGDLDAKFSARNVGL